MNEMMPRVCSPALLVVGAVLGFLSCDGDGDESSGSGGGDDDETSSNGSGSPNCNDCPGFGACSEQGYECGMTYSDFCGCTVQCGLCYEGTCVNHRCMTGSSTQVTAGPGGGGAGGAGGEGQMGGFGGATGAGGFGGSGGN